jgi:hypothetical protein
LIRALVRGYEQDGPVGLISRHRNRAGNRSLKAPVSEEILGILRDHYPDFGPTLAAQQLANCRDIRVAR